MSNGRYKKVRVGRMFWANTGAANYHAQHSNDFRKRVVESKRWSSVGRLP